MKKYLIGIVGLVLAVGAFKYLDAGSALRAALVQIQDFGPWAAVAFIGIYVAACVLFLPGSILTLGAGALFGVVLGTLYVSLGSTLGATAAFLVGRYLARDWVSRKIEGNAKFKAVSGAVAREGWKIVGLVRLSPIFPFNFTNYAFGLTRVSLRDYFFASWIGMLPGTVLYVYIGSLVGNIAQLGMSGHARATMEWIFYGVGLLATSIVTVYITRIARRALRSIEEEK